MTEQEAQRVIKEMADSAGGELWEEFRDAGYPTEVINLVEVRTRVERGIVVMRVAFGDVAIERGWRLRELLAARVDILKNEMRRLIREVTRREL